MISPCKDCEERHRMCHSSCEKYKAFQIENQKRLDYIGKIHRLNDDAFLSRNPKYREHIR